VIERKPYRFAIRAYPAHHRRRHGGELIGTALAMHEGAWSARQSLSFVGNGLWLSLRTPRRWWGLAVLLPMVFAATGLADLVAHGGQQLPGWHEPVGRVAWVAKWLTVPSMPILILLLAEKVAERPVRWRAASGLWLVLGSGLVLSVVSRMAYISDAASSVASWRLWPTTLSSDGMDTLGAYESLGGFGPSWTTGQVIASELLAVVALALASGLALRRCAKDGAPRLAVGAVPVAVMAVLFVYRLAAPWSFRADFDFFVGDAVLGGTIGELLFFPAPFDPIGSLAIGSAAVSMGALIVMWGGVAPAPERVRIVAGRPAQTGVTSVAGSLPGSASES